MPTPNQYWISEHQGIPKETRKIFNQYILKYLNEQEYTRVKLVSEEMSIRFRALVLLLLSSGYRRTELSNLQMQDVNMEKRTGKVRGERKWLE